MKEYRVLVKIKNNYMLTCMEEAAIYTAAELHRASGVDQCSIGAYLNLSRLPVTKTGEWKETVLRLCETLKCAPDALFPPEHINQTLEKNTASFEVSLEEVGTLISGAESNPLKLIEHKEMDTLLNGALDEMPDRSALVLKLHHGIEDGREWTFRDIGQRLGISGGRTAQIYNKTIRMLRYKRKREGTEGRVALQEVMRP
jgi:hypothetical protein